MSRVLIAEDEPALLESYCELVQALGHECFGAQDGNEALDLARRHHPDLVVTDYMMPGRSGIDVLRALRADPVLTRVPVILISAGRPPERDRAQAWRFLSKPITLERFEEAICEGVAVATRVGAPDGFMAGPSEQVSELSLAREEMLNWVAHEFKSPLSAAMTALELTRRSVRSGSELAEAERRLLVVARQLARMNELVNSLLDAAQLQDGRLKLELARVDIVDLVDTAVQSFREMHSDVDFQFGAFEACDVDADSERLRQVLDNLLSNAVKYGRPANRVLVHVEPGDRVVKVAVTDHGRGIPPEQLPRIFDRFHRVPGQGGRGHGLGLYIAAAIARLHGGSVSVDSIVNERTTFTLTIPLASRS